jgi:hypothetical protein
MTPAAPTLLTRLRAMSFSARAGTLALVVALGYAVVAPVGARVGPPGAWGTAALSAGVCLLGGLLALSVSHSLRGPQAALVAMLLAMACRMGIPLVFAAWAHLSGGPLAKAGVLYYVLVFYLIALGAEVVLALPLVEAPASKKSHNRDSQ